MDEISYYTDFAIRVFNLFNGLINPLNKAVRLDTTKKDPPCGCSYMCGCESIISINIELCLFRVGPNVNTRKTMILDVISHELSHLDQHIDMAKYTVDQKYKDEVEDANAKNNIYFICNYKSWIELQLGFTIDTSILYLDAINSTAEYVKVTVEELIMSRLSVIFTTPTINEVIKAKNVILVYALETIEIKLYGEYTYYSIPKLNNFIQHVRGVSISAYSCIGSVGLELHVIMNK